MANVYDQFDEPADAALPAANPYDQFDAPAASSVGPSFGSPSEYLAGLFGGGNEGLLTTYAGIPVDVMNGLIRYLQLAPHVGAAEQAGSIPGPDQVLGYLARLLPPAAEKPLGGKESIKEGIEAVAPTTFYEGPPDALGRTINRVGKEIGANILPTAAVFGAALKTIPRGLNVPYGAPAATTADVIPQAVRGVPATTPQAVGRAIAEGVAANPMKAAIGELAASAGAGLGAGIAKEALPDSPAAEMWGQMAGAIAPSVASFTSPLAWAKRGWDKAKHLVTGETTAADTAAATAQVRKQIGGEMTDEAMRNLEEAERIRKTIPGFDPTLGEATGAPGLLATQRHLEGTAEGTELDRFVGRRRSSERAIEGFAGAVAPKAVGSPDFVIDTANRRVQALRDEVGKVAEGVAKERQELAGTLPTARRELVGQKLGERMAFLRDETKDRMSKLADELGISDADITVSFQRTGKRMVKDFSPQSVFDDAQNYPGVIDAIREATKKGAGPVTFQDLKSLRERVSDDLIDAVSGANPSRKKIRELTMLKGRVDGAIDRLTKSADPDLAERYKQFRNAYRTEYIERFEQGPAFKVRQTDGRGFYKTSDERVAEAFFQPGNVTAAKQFNSTYGGDPEALAAMEAHALDELRDFAVRGGTLDRNRLTTWLRQHDSVLNEYPDIRGKVGSLDKADEALFARQEQLASRAKDIEDQLLTRELNAFAKATKTGDDVLRLALKDPRKMGQLATVLKGEPDALAALKRNVWDMASSGDSGSILKFIADHNASLRQLWKDDPQHFKNLTDISLARSMLERTPEPTGKPYTARPLEQVEKMIGQKLPVLASRVFAFHSGRMSKGYLLTDAFMRSLRGRQQLAADDLFKSALYNRDVAKDLLDVMDSGVMTPRSQARIYAQLVALGVTPPRIASVAATMQNDKQK